MAKVEDLTGKSFGYLKVLHRAKDHVTASGKKKCVGCASAACAEN